MSSLSSLRARMDELSAELRISTANLGKYNSDFQLSSAENAELGDIQELFQVSSKLMYDTLSVRLGNIVTEGLALTFPESRYTFSIEFVERRNSIEADLYLTDHEGNMYHPFDAVGGGVSDFISLLLRCTYVILSKYKNTIIADEPLKFLDKERIVLGAEFVHKICTEFRVQLLMVSHIPEIIELADTIYCVTKRGHDTTCIRTKHLGKHTNDKSQTT